MRVGNLSSVTHVRCIGNEFAGRIVGEAPPFVATLVIGLLACHCESGLHGHQIVGSSATQEGSGRFVRSRKVASGARACAGACANRARVL